MEVESNSLEYQRLNTVLSANYILFKDSRLVSEYVNNLKTAKAIANEYYRLRSLPGISSATIAKTYQYTAFVKYVKRYGAWDLKSEYVGTYYFNGVNKTGEYIGNHHYGYMGRASAIPATELRIGAGVYQVYSDTSDWSFIKSYYDDPADQVAINSGITHFNNNYQFGLLRSDGTIITPNSINLEFEK